MNETSQGTDEKEMASGRMKFQAKMSIDGQSIDWYLQHLVSLANNAGIEMGITLCIGGGTISGLLISGKKYFEAFAKEFSDAWNGGGKEEIYNAFATPAELYEKHEEDGPPAPPPQYIHLIDARVHTPQGSLPTNRSVLWRGKINAVSGFSLGSLSGDDTD